MQALLQIRQKRDYMLLWGELVARFSDFAKEAGNSYFHVKFSNLVHQMGYPKYTCRPAPNVVQFPHFTDEETETLSLSS